MSDGNDSKRGRRGFLRLWPAVVGTVATVAGFGLRYGTEGNTSTPTAIPTPSHPPTSTVAPPTEAMTPFDASEMERIPDVKPIEKEIHRLTNEARTEYGRGTVTWSEDLSYVARDKSRDMAQREYFSHENPDGERSWDLVDDYGLHYSRVSENIAARGLSENRTPNEIAALIFKQWKTSEGHWENILEDRHTLHGAGVYLAENGAWATQLFAIKPE